MKHKIELTTWELRKLIDIVHDDAQIDGDLDNTSQMLYNKLMDRLENDTEKNNGN